MSDAKAAVIRMQINRRTKEKHYDQSAGTHQHGLEMTTVYTSDKEDPNYIFGCLSSGSSMTLKTINDAAVEGFEPGDVLEFTIRKVN